MKKSSVLLLCAILCSCQGTQSYDWVIHRVGLFDGVNDLGIVDVAIRGDTIAAISKGSLSGDSVLDGAGKYIVPGLVNSHSHIWEESQLKESYAAGVLVNMGMHASRPARDSSLKVIAQRNGYSFYYSAGVAATVPGGHPTQVTPGIETINDTFSTRQFVNHRIADGVDFIKIIKESSPWFDEPNGPPSLPYDSIAELIDYAHSNNLKVMVHIGSLEEMTRISVLRPDGFVHMWYSATQADLTDEKLRTIKESNAFVVPTALLNERVLLMAEKEGGDFGQWAKENFLSREELRSAINTIHQTGITILAGTDNGNLDLNWGDDLVNELMLYSQCGLSNTEALRTATGNPARSWDIPVGLLQVGSRVNMLLLNSSPIEDLEALKDIHTIWKDGRTN